MDSYSRIGNNIHLIFICISDMVVNEMKIMKTKTKQYSTRENLFHGTICVIVISFWILLGIYVFTFKLSLKQILTTLYCVSTSIFLLWSISMLDDGDNK
jgi:hypothetical protein